MSQKKKRSPAPPVSPAPAAAPPAQRKPNKAFLAIAALLQTGWLAFLAALALRK